MALFNRNSAMNIASRSESQPTCGLDLPAKRWLIAITKSYLYTTVYTIAHKMKAVNTSNKECCLINIVERIIETASTKEAILIPFLFSKCLLFAMAICAPKEL